MNIRFPAVIKDIHIGKDGILATFFSARQKCPALARQKCPTPPGSFFVSTPDKPSGVTADQSARRIESHLFIR